MTPDSKINPQAVELPGSLLLPSQGFPQSEPPVTPSRHTFERSYSDESSSIWSSTPELSACSTVTALDMDVLRSFSPKKKPTKSSISSQSAASVHKIGKPFSAMTAEDLIQCLPECSPSMIANTWVPAMVREHRKIKNLLQEAATIKMDANAELRDLGAVSRIASTIFEVDLSVMQEIESISNDARKISNNYEQALLRAESLSERDMKIVQDKLGRTEADLYEVLATVDGQRDVINEKEEVIQVLQQNADAIVHILGAFIEDTLPRSMHELEPERVHEVLQLLADYSTSAAAGGHHPPQQPSPPFLRIPEATFQTHLRNLRDIQAKVQSYRKLALGQSNLIKSLSAGLDERVTEYEKCLRTIKERDHEILLLVEQRNAQKKIIEDYESSKMAREVVEIEQERLANQRQAMESTIKKLKTDHEKQIEDRDAEIENLRQKLAHAWEEVLARKADVKNVISQTQALLAPPELPEMVPDTLSVKERKILEKTRTNPVLPSSRSMLSLSMSEATLGFGKLDIPAAPLSAVERIGHKKKSKMRMEPRSPRIDGEGWGYSTTQKKGSSFSLRRAERTMEDLRPRPRKDSLGAMGNNRRGDDLELLETPVKGSVDSTSTTTSINTDKALPIPPDIPPELSPIENIEGGHSVTEDVLQNLFLSNAPQHGFCTPLSPRNRVLSGIPEMSVEDAESNVSSLSATSSDKEVYRKSIDALKLIEFMRESDMWEDTATADDQGHDAGPVLVGVANEARFARGPVSPITVPKTDMTGSRTQERPRQ